VDRDQPDHKAQLESEEYPEDKAVPERMVNQALLDTLYDVMLNDYYDVCNMLGCGWTTWS